MMALMNASARLCTGGRGHGVGGHRPVWVAAVSPAVVGWQERVLVEGAVLGAAARMTPMLPKGIGLIPSPGGGCV